MSSSFWKIPQTRLKMQLMQHASYPLSCKRRKKRMPKKIPVEFIENFLIVWDQASGSELYKKGYYGKHLGIAKPKTPEFNVPLILDLMEGLYLTEKGTITVHEGPDKKKVTLKKLKQMAKQLYEEFDEKYAES